MVVPQFLRFYGGYTISSVLQEYAITFFGLVNSMFRIQAKEALSIIASNNADAEIVKDLQQASKGVHGIVQEVRNIKP